MFIRNLSIFFVNIFLIHCGTHSSSQSGPSGSCNVIVRQYEVQSAIHVPRGSPIQYESNPPSGGNHYASWARWGIHTQAIPRGNWVHNLEHGGVVFTYRCASKAACPDVAAQVEAIANALPEDRTCLNEGGLVRRRVVVVPDPLLPEGIQVAASAWGYTLTAHCVDQAAMRSFFLEHVGHGAEDTCAEGSVDDAVLSQ